MDRDTGEAIGRLKKRCGMVGAGVWQGGGLGETVETLERKYRIDRKRYFCSRWYRGGVDLMAPEYGLKLREKEIGERAAGRGGEFSR